MWRGARGDIDTRRDIDTRGDIDTRRAVDGQRASVGCSLTGERFDAVAHTDERSLTVACADVATLAVT